LSDFGEPQGGRNAGWANPTERGASHVHIGIAIVAGIAIGAVLVLLAVQVFGATSVGKARRIHRQLRGGNRDQSL